MGLFDALKKLPTLNELQGNFGEWLAKTYAKTIPGALVLHDVLIDGAEGYTAQIDLLIIGNRGVYVIEVKTYPDAKLYGDLKKSKWAYYNHGRKYEIYSPVRQNQKHVEYLKTCLKDFGEVPCFSVIAAICNDFKLSGAMPPNTAVCNSLPTMERALYKLAEGHPDVLDETKKQELFRYIQDNQHTEKGARITHKEAVISYKTQLDELKQKKLCPYCKTELVARNGKYGAFFGCPNYPKCRYTLK